METFLSNFKELGIAGVAVASITVICLRILKALNESQRDYKNFVQDNNHTTTELVREATSTMVEVREAIKNHNAISENQNEVLKILLEKVK